MHPESTHYRHIIREAAAARARARRLVGAGQPLIDAAKALRAVARGLTGRGALPRPPSIRRLPLPFAVSGIVRAWNPISREMQVGERLLTVAPAVSVTGLALGAGILAAGHQEQAGAPHVITRLILRSR